MTKIMIVFIVLLVMFIKCSNKSEFEFCFSTIVNGTVAVGEAKIGDIQVPCGFLSSSGGAWSNEGLKNIENRDLCGATACCFLMEIPDSAFLGWGCQLEGHAARPDLIKRYKKAIKLPPFPDRKRNERYRVSFAIAYQDCVYCRIETVKK